MKIKSSTTQNLEKIQPTEQIAKKEQTSKTESSEQQAAGKTSSTRTANPAELSQTGSFVRASVDAKLQNIPGQDTPRPPRAPKIDDGVAGGSVGGGTGNIPAKDHNSEATSDSTALKDPRKSATKEKHQWGQSTEPQTGKKVTEDYFSKERQLRDLVDMKGLKGRNLPDLNENTGKFKLPGYKDGSDVSGQAGHSSVEEGAGKNVVSRRSQQSEDDNRSEGEKRAESGDNTFSEEQYHDLNSQAEAERRGELNNLSQGEQDDYIRENAEFRDANIKTESEAVSLAAQMHREMGDEQAAQQEEQRYRDRIHNNSGRGPHNDMPVPDAVDSSNIGTLKDPLTVEKQRKRQVSLGNEEKNVPDEIVYLEDPVNQNLKRRANPYSQPTDSDYVGTTRGTKKTEILGGHGPDAGGGPVGTQPKKPGKAPDNPTS